MAGWHKPREAGVRQNREQCRSGHASKGVFMKSQAIMRAALAAAMLLPVGFVTIASAQGLDRDRDQLKTQQQLKDKDKLQIKDQLHKDQLKDKDMLKEQERMRERERAREHMQTERPEKPRHERAERGERGGR